MRARTRTIKPEIFSDEVLGDLELATGLPLFRLFVGLWCYSDREGRFEWSLRALRGFILPCWDGDMGAALDALASKSYIVRYTVNGKDYGYVRTFVRHQQIHKNEAPSILPSPEAHGVELPLPVITGNYREAPGNYSALPPESEVPRQPKPVSSTSTSTSTCGSDPDARARVASTMPTPSQPELVARTYSMPSQEAPQDYLDDALLAGVSKTQAESTWAHYFGAGLPERGVERLNAWMVQRAKERSTQTAGAKARTDTWRGRQGVSTQTGPPLDASASQRAYAAKHGLDVDAVIAELTRAGVVDALGIKGAREELTKRLQVEARKKGTNRHAQQPA